MSTGEMVGEYKVLSTNEDRIVNSLGGILSNVLGVWNKNHGRFPTKSNPNPRTKPGVLYEKLEEYSCQTDGCNCQVDMYRVNGGIVFLEKTDSDEDVMVHDETGMSKCFSNISFQLRYHIVALHLSHPITYVRCFCSFATVSNISFLRFRLLVTF